MAKIYPYGSKLARLLANPPERGGNRHTWLFRVAASFKAQGADMDEVQRRLEEAARSAGWTDRLPEIARNIAKLRNSNTAPPSARLWMPCRNDAARACALAAPPMFAPSAKDIAAQQVLPRLFRPDDWVCMAADQAHATTQRLADVLPVADRMAFVVANPMRAAFGRTREGHVSPRSLDNAALSSDRRYAVIEFDTGDTLDAQARLLSALHTPDAPLALVVFSGGKSLHGWFNVGALRLFAKLQVFRRGV